MSINLSTRPRHAYKRRLYIFPCNKYHHSFTSRCLGKGMKNDSNLAVFIILFQWTHRIVCSRTVKEQSQRQTVARNTISSIAIVAALISFSLYPGSTFAKGWLRKLADADVSVQRIADVDLPIRERASYYFQQYSPPDDSNISFLARDANGVTHIVDSNGRIETFESNDELTRRIPNAENPINPRSFAMVEADYFYFIDELKAFSNGEMVQVILRNGEMAIAKQFLSNGKIEVGLELDSGVIYHGNSASALTNAIKFLNVNFDARDVSVLSLFSRDDFVANQRIAMAGKELHRNIASSSSENIINLVTSMRQKIIVVVGHVEGPDFVVRQADGTASLQLPINDLERAAINADASLILLGCNTSKYSASTGLLSTTKDTDVAKSISLALASADYGGFFSHLAGTEAPFLLRGHTLNGQGRLMIKRQMSERHENQVTGVYVSTIIVAGLSPAESAVLRSRYIFFIPNSFTVTYFSGAILALMRVQSFWKNWRKLWPLAPSRANRPLIARIVISLKWILFLFLAPIAGVVFLPLVALAILMFFIPFIPCSSPLGLLKFCVKGKGGSVSPAVELQGNIGSEINNRANKDAWNKKSKDL